VIGARWSEIHLLDNTWTVPAARMKAQREHRVPLSPGVLAILECRLATVIPARPLCLWVARRAPGFPTWRS
jgi:integrase